MDIGPASWLSQPGKRIEMPMNIPERWQTWAGAHPPFARCLKET
jgi:hypothetical protein